MVGVQLEGFGDREIYSGDLRSAKQSYGAAIDAYLRDRDYEAAIRTCRKLIRLAPDVVRTHYTLAYLLVGQALHREAAEAVKAYGAAVRASGSASYARSLLTLLAFVTDDPGVRLEIERILFSIGPLSAEATPAALEATLRELSKTGTTAQERWSRLLPIALLDP